VPNAAPDGAASAPGSKPSWSWPTCTGGDTYTRLAGGFAIGTTTARRYVREAVDLVAALADDVHTAARKASRLAYAVLDGTLIPIDRLADERPYYSRKRHRHRPCLSRHQKRSWISTVARGASPGTL
jgi:hypothetical protein